MEQTSPPGTNEERTTPKKAMPLVRPAICAACVCLAGFGLWHLFRWYGDLRFGVHPLDCLVSPVVASLALASSLFVGLGLRRRRDGAARTARDPRFLVGGVLVVLAGAVVLGEFVLRIRPVPFPGGEPKRILFVDDGEHTIEDIYDAGQINIIGCDVATYSKKAVHETPGVKTPDDLRAIRRRFRRDSFGLRGKYSDPDMRLVLCTVAAFSGVHPLQLHPDEPIQAPNVGLDELEVLELMIALEDMLQFEFPPGDSGRTLLTPTRMVQEIRSARASGN